MALVPDQKFSTFQVGGALQVNDIIVGLRGGINTRFTYSGVLPPGVIVPISQGGTGATTASGARDNLGLGTADSPNFTNLTLTGGEILDQYGNIVVSFTGVPSAVNYISIINSITGQVPGLIAAGGDTNLGIVLSGKGTGGVGFITQNTSVPFNFYSGTNAQHVTNFAMANTANNVTATWQDSSGTVAWLSDIPGGSPFQWSVISGTSQAAAINNGYISQNAAQTTFTLPVSAPIGSIIAVEGLGAAGWIIQANGSQTIQGGSSITSAGGTITSQAGTDSAYLLCVTTDNVWKVTQTYSQGLTYA